jgi:hypothetical protein
VAPYPGGTTIGSSVPSDFQWTFILYDYICYCHNFPGFGGYIGDAVISCNGVGASAGTGVAPGSCNMFFGDQGTWAPVAGSSLSNVTVTFQ